MELRDIKSDLKEMTALLGDVVDALQGRAQPPHQRTGSIRDFAVRRQQSAATSMSAGSIRRQQSAATSRSESDVAPVGQSVSQVSVSSVYQNPNDTSTWRPKRPGLPPFAANYEFLQYTSIKDLVEEYLIGSRGRPALKDIEKYFGPKREVKVENFHLGGAEVCAVRRNTTRGFV